MVMVGAGSLAPFLIRAHMSQRPIAEVLLWNHRAGKGRSAGRKPAAEGLPVTATSDLEAAVREADLVSCATLSRQPIIQGEWLKAGTHLDLVGAFNLAMREADDAALQRSQIYVDTMAAKSEGGDVALALQSGAIDEQAVRGDLFGLCARTPERDPDAITLFKSVGASLEDLAAAMLVWRSLPSFCVEFGAMDRLIKICGLSTPETLDAALIAGADLVGFVRFAESPRHVSLEAGRALSAQAKGARSASCCWSTPRTRRSRLHRGDGSGHAATARPRDARARERHPRALRPAGPEGDRHRRCGRPRAGSSPMLTAADHLLLDAKPPRTASALPGGNGLSFDWTLLAGLDPTLPFMLSGGLDPGNVAEAIALTRPDAVDVSSGVEIRPGIKDPARIEAFIQAARAAFAVPAA